MPPNFNLKDIFLLKQIHFQQYFVHFQQCPIVENYVFYFLFIFEDLHLKNKADFDLGEDNPEQKYHGEGKQLHHYHPEAEDE